MSNHSQIQGICENLFQNTMKINVANIVIWTTPIIIEKTKLRMSKAVLSELYHHSYKRAAINGG